MSGKGTPSDEAPPPGHWVRAIWLAADKAAWPVADGRRLWDHLTGVSASDRPALSHPSELEIIEDEAGIIRWVPL